VVSGGGGSCELVPGQGCGAYLLLLPAAALLLRRRRAG
jgi:hypothetical protein